MSLSPLDVFSFFVRIEENGFLGSNILDRYQILDNTTVCGGEIEVHKGQDPRKSFVLCFTNNNKKN